MPKVTMEPDRPRRRKPSVKRKDRPIKTHIPRVQQTGGIDFCSKTPHPTRKQAEKNMRHFMNKVSRGNKSRKSGNVRVYQCGCCNQWHWGHWKEGESVKR